MRISIYIYPFVSVIIVSFVSFVGVLALSLQKERLQKYLFIFVSLALGALLGDAFIHLIPETFESITNTTMGSIAIVIGIFIFLGVEKGLHWHHHEPSEAEMLRLHPVGRMILIADGLHNFIDGLVIGASYFVSTEVGIATTIAVILHEIPQEIGDFGVLISSGYTPVRALWFNFLSALTAIVGIIIALMLQGVSDVLTIWIIPIAAGGFIYIAIADLIPELQKTKGLHSSLLQFFIAFLGVLAMAALTILE